MAKYYYVDDNKQKSGPVNPEEFPSYLQTPLYHKRPFA